MRVIKSRPTLESGCPCGTPFPLRVYFASDAACADSELPHATFLLTCRACGKTYPLAVEGLGGPPLGGERAAPGEPGGARSDPSSTVYGPVQPPPPPPRQGPIMGGGPVVTRPPPAPKGFTMPPTLAPVGVSVPYRCTSCGFKWDLSGQSPQVECPSCGILQYRTMAAV